jgi:hypothetical protein
MEGEAVASTGIALTLGMGVTTHGDPLLGGFGHRSRRIVLLLGAPVLRLGCQRR